MIHLLRLDTQAMLKIFFLKGSVKMKVGLLGVALFHSFPMAHTMVNRPVMGVMGIRVCRFEANIKVYS